MDTERKRMTDQQAIKCSTCGKEIALGIEELYFESAVKEAGVIFVEFLESL